MFILLIPLYTCSYADAEITIKNGISLGVTKNEIIELFNNNDASKLMAVNMKITEAINNENVVINGLEESVLKLENQIEIQKTNFSEFQNEINKGLAIMEEFDGSAAKRDQLKEEINYMETQINECVDAMLPENFNDNTANRNAVAALKEQIVQKNKELIELEEDKQIIEFQVRREKSLYEIRQLSSSTELYSQQQAVQRHIGEYTQKIDGFAVLITNGRELVENGKEKLVEARKRNGEMAGKIQEHEDFLLVYKSGNLASEIDRFIRKQNEIVEYLKEGKWKLQIDFDNFDRTLIDLENTIKILENEHAHKMEDVNFIMQANVMLHEASVKTQKEIVLELQNFENFLKQFENLKNDTSVDVKELQKKNDQIKEEIERLVELMQSFLWKKKLLKSALILILAFFAVVMVIQVEKFYKLIRRQHS